MSLFIGAVTAAPVPLIDGIVRDQLRRHRDFEPRRPGGGRRRSPATSAQEANSAPLSTFRGRSREIAQLLQLHRSEREARRRPSTDSQARTGPVVITIHGKPGVGKSDLARELAAHLAKEYKAGLIYENFGFGGPRPAAEIVHSILLAMGFPDKAIPTDAIGAAHMLRSVTAGKPWLFVFDAARHHDQVLQVMPTNIRCTVIVTSRRDMSAALNAASSAMWLDVPSVEESLDILSAVAAVDWRTDAEAALEVVELCGMLPLAIKSAAERVAIDGTNLRHVADLLRRRETRLTWLEHGGRGVEERYRSEYARLVGHLPKAFCVLTLLKSPTFVPWVLSPLLDVGNHEAENIMASLGAAQLLDEAGQDPASGVARYRFNPLVHLYAQAELRKHDESAPDAEWEAPARQRLNDAYLALTGAVLHEIDASHPRPPSPWLSGDDRAIAAVAARPEETVRAEYDNLIGVINNAPTDLALAGLRWRVAARLRGCVSVTSTQKEIIDAFELGASAADLTQNPLGRIEVLLANASYLVAVERYQDAFDALEQADKLTDQAAAAGSDNLSTIATFRARAARKRAEAYAQMGAYGLADVFIDKAVPLADAAGGDLERRLLMVMRADLHQVSSLDATVSADPGSDLHDPIRFRSHLNRSEAARRKRIWRSAEAELLSAERASLGDARRLANVHYRLSRLYLARWCQSMPNLGITDDEASAGDSVPIPGSDRSGELRPLLTKAILRSAEAALAFHRMGNLVGAVRAQCLHVRALAAANLLLAAERTVRDVTAQLGRPEVRWAPVYPSVRARYTRAYGEMMLHRGDLGAAWELLVRASELFAQNKDWSSQAECLALMDAAQRVHPYPQRYGLAAINQALDGAFETLNGKDSGDAAHWQPISQRRSPAEAHTA
ncbi:NB-ARC domain-containing protein [Hamadaea flava]|uniref:NB-ARC domain-containing protein n=1 Tax=Hamadaea flava TaxID=1742688 RepID=UPI0020A576A6|nr:NB-ARC domain-containing protein [Hamadaea flava]